MQISGAKVKAARLLIVSLIALSAIASADGDRCQITLDSLAVTGPALEIATDLSGLYASVQAEQKQALKGLLLISFHEKVVALHQELAREGKAIPLRDLASAIKSYSSTARPDSQRGESRDQTITLPEILTPSSSHLRSFQHRHEIDTEKGWETLRNVPRKLEERGVLSVEGGIGGPPAVLADGTFVLCTNFGAFYHFGVNAQGKLEKLGELHIPGEKFSATPTVLPDGSVVFPTWETNGSLYRVKLKKGSQPEEWEILDSVSLGQSESTPAVLPDGSFIIGTYGAHLSHFRINQEDKLEKIGTWELENTGPNSPEILSDGSILINVTYTNKLHHVKKEVDGKITIHQFAKAIRYPTVLDDGTLIGEAENGVLYHLEITSDGSFRELGSLPGVGAGIGLPTSLTNKSVISGGNKLLHLAFTPNGQFVELGREEKEEYYSTPLPLPTGEVIAASMGGFLNRYRVESDGALTRLDHIPLKDSKWLGFTLLQNGRFVVISNTDVGPKNGQVHLFQVVPAK